MIDSIPDFLLLGGVLIGGAVSFHQIKNRGSLFFSVFKTGDPEEKNPHPCTVIATLGGCFLLGIFLAYFWSTELSSLLLRFDLLFGSLSNSAGSFGIWGPVLVFGGIFLMGIGMRYFGERPSPETSRREGYMWKQEKIRRVSLWLAVALILWAGYFFLRGYENVTYWGMAAVWTFFALLNLANVFTWKGSPPGRKVRPGSVRD